MLYHGGNGSGNCFALNIIGGNIYCPDKEMEFAY